MLIDEWQRLPESWDLIREAVDAGAAPGSFLLTGSSVPADDNSPVHSGAGRIPRVRMRPMTLAFEKIRDAATGRREGGGPTRKTTIAYRDALERLWLLDPVPAWLPTRNYLSQLGAAPKHQLADPALAVRLLGVDAGALLAGREVGPPMPRDGLLLGALFESLVTLNVRVYAQQSEATVKHLRTHRGDHEVDLIVQRADERVVAIEVKLAQTVGDADVRHLNWLANEVGDDLLDRVVVTTEGHAYRRQDGVAVVPAALLGA